MRRQPNVESLPVLTLAAGEQLQKQGQLFQLLSAWIEAGAATPLTFQDLMDHATMGADTPLFMRSALGTAWEKWFVNQPQAQDTVPRQVVILLHTSLTRLRNHWEDAEKTGEIAEAAQGSYAAMIGQSKKRRAQLFDISMEPAALEGC